MSLSIYVQVWLYTLFLATSLTLRISHGGNGNSRGKRRKCHKGEKVEDVECLNHNFFLSLFSLQSLQCGKGAMIVVQYSHHYCTEPSFFKFFCLLFSLPMIHVLPQIPKYVYYFSTVE